MDKISKTDETQHKSGYVAIVGRPNVGKSTLMNRLVGEKVAITANKPQTTRQAILAIRNEPAAQIVFLDTPGIHKTAKNRLGTYMLDAAYYSLEDADIVCWLVEPTDFIGPDEQHIAERIGQRKTPVILIINKIDMVKKEKLLGIIATYDKLFSFAEIIPVSAREGHNVERLLGLLHKYLPVGPRFYDADMLTDQSIKTRLSEIIREKALHSLAEEVPHGIAVWIDTMERRGKLYDIAATIICERDSHKRIIIGKGGASLKKIGTNARYEMEQLLKRKVHLQLWVKVKKDWRDSEYVLRDLGFRYD